MFDRCFFDNKALFGKSHCAKYKKYSPLSIDKNGLHFFAGAEVLSYLI